MMLTNLDTTLALAFPSDRELLITRTFAAPRHLVDHKDIEEVIRVEVAVLEIAVLQRDFQFVREGSVDVLGAQILDLVALLPPVDQRPVDVGVDLEVLLVLGADALGITPPLEGVDDPGIPGDIARHLRQPLHAEFAAQPRIAAQQRDVTELHGEIALREIQPPGGFERAHGAQRREAAAGLDVLLHELVDIECLCGRHHQQQ